MEVVKEAGVAKPRLPPGFRFRPTDEELVVHYLRRRALASPLPAAVDIPDIRILAHDPSDLLPPGWSEQERYFFTCKEAKYVKGRRANRATGAGYWKATGKEKPVAVTVPAPAPPKGGAPGHAQQGQAVLVGMKRSLVFYRGKPPTGSKTDWVMHEYRLAGAGLAPCRRAAGGDAAATPAEGWVLCRVFRKKGSASANAAAANAASPGDRSDGEAEEEEEAGGAEEAAEGGRTFIDFFARADAAGRRQQQAQGQAEQQRRAASPVVSSSCLTDEQHGGPRGEQETTSRGA
ncbi:NAC domain-containing protein 83 [Dichanthelium oligosanthes]|uniref:NAC domain-containing protein 83 n=1 Tax=Dichanthelium oligosanthes TaxID=888268 RepID=A0A1E5VY72_9POAL|nr:NAC domain-containing protein 83 [Dichanthelium oligosanthes]